MKWFIKGVKHRLPIHRSSSDFIFRDGSVHTGSFERQYSFCVCPTWVILFLGYSFYLCFLKIGFERHMIVARQKSHLYSPRPTVFPPDTFSYKQPLFTLWLTFGGWQLVSVWHLYFWHEAVEVPALRRRCFARLDAKWFFVKNIRGSRRPIHRYRWKINSDWLYEQIKHRSMTLQLLSWITIWWKT